jgi:hypothetical protein
MELEHILAKIKAVVAAHENLVVAIEDFANNCLSEGVRKRLEDALKESRRVINSD